MSFPHEEVYTTRRRVVVSHKTNRAKWYMSSFSQWDHQCDTTRPLSSRVCKLNRINNNNNWVQRMREGKQNEGKKKKNRRGKIIVDWRRRTNSCCPRQRRRRRPSYDNNNNKIIFHMCDRQKKMKKRGRENHHHTTTVLPTLLAQQTRPVSLYTRVAAVFLCLSLSLRLLYASYYYIIYIQCVIVTYYAANASPKSHACTKGPLCWTSDGYGVCMYIYIFFFVCILYI